MHHYKTFTHRQSGLSLLELLISVAIGLVIIGMMGNAYISSNQTTRDLNEASLMTENGRYAMAVLKDEVQIAGAFGFLDNQPSAIAALPDPCAISVATLTSGMSVPISGYNNVGEVGGAPANILGTCLAPTGDTVKTGTDILVIRRAHSDTFAINWAAANPLNPDTFYIQASTNEFVLNNGVDHLLFNLTEIDGITPIELRTYMQKVFYVSALDDQLKQLIINEDAYRVEPVADNIEDFQLEFGIDTSENGAPNNFLPEDPLDPALTVDQWQDVVAVRALLLLRSDAETNDVQDTRVYNMGQEKDVGPFNDNFKRRLFYFSARANNLSMRREN